MIVLVLLWEQLLNFGHGKLGKVMEKVMEKSLKKYKPWVRSHMKQKPTIVKRVSDVLTQTNSDKQNRIVEDNWCFFKRVRKCS